MKMRMNDEDDDGLSSALNVDSKTIVFFNMFISIWTSYSIGIL